MKDVSAQETTYPDKRNREESKNLDEKSKREKEKLKKMYEEKKESLTDPRQTEPRVQSGQQRL